MLSEIVRRIWRRKPPSLKSYTDYTEAKGNSTGYSNSRIAQVVLDKTRNALSSSNILLNQHEVQNLYIINKLVNKGIRSILDIGGACGMHFIHFDKFLNVSFDKYHVLETKEMCLKGRSLDLNDVKFIDKPIPAETYDFVFLSGVIQYFEKFESLFELLQLIRPKYVYISRTPFVIRGNLEFPIFFNQISNVADHGPGKLEIANNEKVSVTTSLTTKNQFVDNIQAMSYKITTEIQEAPLNYQVIDDQKITLEHHAFLLEYNG